MVSIYLKTLTDGYQYVVYFKDDEPWNGTYYNNNGKKEYKLVNGEIE